MLYREFPPPPALQRFVRCAWTLRLAATEARPQLVVPDGCTELIVNLAAAMPMAGAPVGAAPPVAFVVGQIDAPITLLPQGAVATVGLRLRPGGLFPLLGLPLDELAEGPVDLADVAPELAAGLAERLAERDDDRARAAELGAEVERRLARRAGPPRLAECAALWIEAAGGALSVEDLARRGGATARTLQRAFATEVGLAPKLLSRILRFQRALACLRGVEPPRWAAVSATCGYADQSHLVRDFHELAGAAPTAFLAAPHPLASAFAGLAGRREPLR